MPGKPLIQPAEIRQKAERHYQRFVSAWLQNTPFFPLHIPGIGVPDDSLTIARQQVQALRNGSREILGYGYTVVWQERSSRRHGRNLFPVRIVFEDQDNYLRFIQRAQQFREFTSAVTAIRSRFPQLESWLQKNHQLLMRNHRAVDGLLEVTHYLQQHPRPGLFAREIPVSVDTKFIEQNAAILEQWLNQVLPPQTIRADERHFERRFGLRYAEPLILLRFLDPELMRQFGSPWNECAVPLHTLAGRPVPAAQAMVVENKVNLLTLPPLPGTIAIGGLGNSVVDLTYLSWLADQPLWYWGDLDVEGFEILHRLRIRFPHTRSLLMDAQTLATWQSSLSSLGSGRCPEPLPRLTAEELAAFRVCAEGNVRIEQERIPQPAILNAIEQVSTNDGHASP